MNNSTILDLFSNHNNEKIASNYLSKDVVNSLGFKDSLRLAYRLLYNKNWETNLQRYAIQLIQSVKSKFPKEWDSDWRNEAFLGSAYNIVLIEDEDYLERYNAYMRAYKKVDQAPAELLIELARCSRGPDKTPVSYEQGIDWLKKSIEIEPYPEAAGLLSAIYFSLGDKNRMKHWQNVMKELEAASKRKPPLEPAFVREGYV